MIVDGDGLIARAFREHGDPTVPGVVFARGVPDSTTTDESAYARELAALRVALDQAADLGQPLVYFSGASIYGRFDAPVDEARGVAPVTRYGRHQLECETLVRASGARSLILRLPNVVGPGGNERQLVPSLVSQALEGSMVIRDGAWRDLLDVVDLVDIASRLLGSDPATDVVVVASGRSVPVRAIADRIADILGLAPAIRLAPGGDSQRFRIQRLAGLVADLPFDEAYPWRVLERYVPIIAGIPLARQAHHPPSAGAPPAAS